MTHPLTLRPLPRPASGARREHAHHPRPSPRLPNPVTHARPGIIDNFRAICVHLVLVLSPLAPLLDASGSPTLSGGGFGGAMDLGIRKKQAACYPA